jgi:hypothetical protein
MRHRGASIRSRTGSAAGAFEDLLYHFFDMGGAID